MRLLLAEQTLLLTLDDRSGRDTSAWAGGAGLAAALLIDLSLCDLLRTDAEQKLVAADGPPPEHPLLRQAHEVIRASSRRRDAKGWVDRLQSDLEPLHQRLARGLVERGVLSEQRTKVLGIFPRTGFPEADPTPEAELRSRLLDVLVAGRAPTEEEALLVGLLAPLGLIDRTVPKDQRPVARRRADEIGEHGVAGTAVSQAVQEIQTAVITAAVMPVIITTTTT